KMVAFMARQTRPVWDFEDIGDWWTRADADAIYPNIAVPTTAGTGSEVGRASVLTNTSTQQKKIIFHPKVLPSVVIADAELTTTMPAAITAGTGMDALAHCIEAFSSPHYHPMSQGIALEGMALVFENLPKVMNSPGDLDARGHMMCAAMMGATAFQKGLGAVHALSHPIGAMHDTHHGTTNAVVIEAVMQFNLPAVVDRFARAAAYCGVSGGADGFIAAVAELRDQLGIPSRLSGIGVSGVDKDALVAGALQDPSAGGNPIALTEDNTRALFEAVL
ncbi:MAG: iron-containing alcohol dehydrogenase, partial [Pseudomonadota bacterium]